MPVIKVTGNPHTYQNLPEHMDILVDTISGTDSISESGEMLYREILAVASGKKTKAELLNYGNFPNIFTIGPVI